MAGGWGRFSRTLGIFHFIRPFSYTQDTRHSDSPPRFAQFTVYIL